MPDSSSPRVLQVRRSDEEGSYVILHVSRTDSAPLEVSIVATEGECPYATTVRQSQLKSLRAKNYQGNDDEWKNTVLYVFGLLEESARKPDFLSGIESSASITGSGEEDKEIVITIRKRIEAITQRLGSVALKQDDEQAIELFGWSSTAIARADTLEQRLDSLLDRYRTAEDTISSLNKQLEELISSKNQHEEQLMADFVQLLNEKKLKIRNQQRLLASAKVDTEKLSEMQTLGSTDHDKPGAKSRGSKRSARDTGADESESDDGFEKMDVDQSGNQATTADDEETDGGRSTPQPLEDGGDTTSGGEDSEPPVVQPRAARQPESKPSGRAIPAPPPRRELPFARKGQRQAHTASATPEQQQDPGETAGETDDDEL